MTIQTFTYPNGFRIVYEKTKNESPISSIHAFCELGSVYETDGIRGVSHFIEHMCFKGTKKIPKPKDIFIEYDKIGAYFNAYTEKEYTCYTIKCDNDYIENSIVIMSDMLLNSTFNKKEYVKEEKVVIEENARDHDDPEDLLCENMDKLIYKGSSYANSVDTIAYHKKRMDYEKVLEIYKLFYVPNRMVLSIVSNFSFDYIKQIIYKTFFIEKIECLPIPVEYQIKPFVLPQTNILYNIDKKIGINTTHLSIGFKIDPCNKYVLNMLKNLLSGPMSARLFMILREDNGLTYSSDIDTCYHRDIGDFTFYAEVDNNKVMKNDFKPGVLPLIIQLINELIEHGVKQSELEITRGYIRGQLNIDLEDSDEAACYNGEQALLYPNKKIIPYSKAYDTFYKNITKKEVDAIIKKYFKKSNMNVCLVGEKLPALNDVKTICEKVIQ
jgi:predicted Zn-dependent peptidase